MSLDRRSFIQTAGLSAAAISFTSALAHAAHHEPNIGMCDWNLGGSCKPELIPKAAEAHLNGLQVSVATNPNNVPLRDPKVREKYLELGEKHNIKFSSVAAGSILNSIPLATEPQSAVYVIDAVEAAQALGCKNILMAFFGNGDLVLTDATNKKRNLSNDKFNEFELDSQKVTRVVEVLKQIVPRAADAGVALGLENTITAKQNLEIIERVGSEWLQVYYDIGNSTGNGYNVPEEIRLLGNDRICEIHLKDWDTRFFPDGKGMVKWDEVAQACKDINYDKWYVLETSGRDKKFMEDTHENIKFAKNLLA
ncbi:MAG: sugar phosphate isomerase/epimerase family protein [Candidatus Hinthialibacter antarcticus]|nr:sugar phosphate isomerase/epimerase family protein [Candidatus Hinthialibacter antarcticus]